MIRLYFSPCLFISQARIFYCLSQMQIKQPEADLISGKLQNRRLRSYRSSDQDSDLENKMAGCSQEDTQLTIEEDKIYSPYGFV